MLRVCSSIRSVIVSCVLAFAGLAVFAQTPSSSSKVLTPEQKAYQQKWQPWLARHQSLQAQAKQIYNAELAQEKAGDCPNATTTFDLNVCYGRQLRITDANLKAFEDDIRGLLAPAPSLPGQPANPTAPSGPAPPAQQRITEFNRVEQLWQQYRDAACSAAFQLFDGGTGGPSFQMECELRLARDHMRELNTVYGMVLHL